MLWFILSLASAFLTASEAAWLKRYFSDMNAVELSAAPLLMGLPIFLCAIPFVNIPELKEGFWLAFIILIPLNAAGYFMHMKAIHVSPISLTMPLLSFTPVFVIASGYLILGEEPSLPAVAGIIAITVGSYILNLSGSPRRAWLAPIKAAALEPGTRYMIAAALIYSITSVLGKAIIIKSSPEFAVIIFSTVLSVVYITFFSMTGHLKIKKLLKRPLAGAGIGIIFSLGLTAHFFGIALAHAAYMIAIKRLNGLFSVLYGNILLKEENLWFRLAGAATMAIGASVIAVFA